MQSARIAELLDPFLGPPNARRLAPGAFQHISTYIDLLQRWNARVNLTAIRNEEEIVTRHFGESLFAASFLFPSQDREGHGFSRAGSTSDIGTASAPESRTARDQVQDSTLRAADAPRAAIKDAVRVADLGSGAGFPGIPMKLWAPEISLTLIESNQKKAAFLREVTRALTLTNINIQNTRAESLAGMNFDVVTLRAVERFESILPTAAALVTKGGRLALLVGQAQLSQARSSQPSLTWLPPIPIPDSQSRVLAIAMRLQIVESTK